MIVDLVDRINYRRGQATTLAFVSGRRAVGGTSASYNTRWRGASGGGVSTTKGDYEPGSMVLMSRNEAGYVIEGLPPNDKRATQGEQSFATTADTGKLI